MLGPGYCSHISPWPAGSPIVTGNKGHLRETGKQKDKEYNFLFLYPYLPFHRYNNASSSNSSNWFQEELVPVFKSSTLPEPALWCPLRGAVLRGLGSSASGPPQGTAGQHSPLGKSGAHSVKLLCQASQLQ